MTLWAVILFLHLRSFLTYVTIDDFCSILVHYLFTQGASFFFFFLKKHFITYPKKKIHVCGLLLCRELRPYAISGRRAVPAHIELPDWAADVSFLTHFFSHVEYHFFTLMHVFFFSLEDFLSTKMDSLNILDVLCPWWFDCSSAIAEAGFCLFQPDCCGHCPHPHSLYWVKCGFHAAFLAVWLVGYPKNWAQ